MTRLFFWVLLAALVLPVSAVAQDRDDPSVYDREDTIDMEVEAAELRKQLKRERFERRMRDHHVKRQWQLRKRMRRDKRALQRERRLKQHRFGRTFKVRVVRKKPMRRYGSGPLPHGVKSSGKKRVKKKVVRTARPWVTRQKTKNATPSED